MTKVDKNERQIILAMMWSKGYTHPFLVGIQTCAVKVEISMAVPQED